MESLTIHVVLHEKSCRQLVVCAMTALTWGSRGLSAECFSWTVRRDGKGVTHSGKLDG